MLEVNKAIMLYIFSQKLEAILSSKLQTKSGL